MKFLKIVLLVVNLIGNLCRPTRVEDSEFQILLTDIVRRNVQVKKVLGCNLCRPTWVEDRFCHMKFPKNRSPWGEYDVLFMSVDKC